MKHEITETGPPPPVPPSRDTDRERLDAWHTKKTLAAEQKQQELWSSDEHKKRLSEVNEQWKNIGRMAKNTYPSYFSSEPSIDEFFRKGWAKTPFVATRPEEELWRTSTFESDSAMPDNMFFSINLALKRWVHDRFKNDSIEVIPEMSHGDDVTGNTLGKFVYRYYLRWP